MKYVQKKVKKVMFRHIKKVAITVVINHVNMVYSIVALTMRMFY